jgi:nitrate/nitrite transporter NarK
MGGMCVCIGLLNPHDHATMIGLIACMAFFMDGANGANFAVVPHVFPSANGMSHLNPHLIALCSFVFRNSLWCRRCHRKLGWCNLRHHLPVQR